MQNLAEAVQAVLDRHPAPALRIDDLEPLLERELPARPPPAEQLLRTLERRSELVRVLEPRPRRWIGPPPRPCVIARRPGGPSSTRSLTGRMRESLRRIGERADATCARALARWERYLLEESDARAALEGALHEPVIPPPPPSLLTPSPRRRGGRRRSTTRPRGPLRPG